MIRQNVSEFVKQADAAMEEAAEVVLQRARQHNTPIVVWRDGRVVELDPHSPEADAQVIRDHGEWLGLAMGEGGRHGAGMVDEYRAFVGPWGFALADITVPTHIYQGTADQLVAPGWAKELAAGITGAELTEYDGEGHMIALSHRADVVRGLLEPIA